MEGQPCYNSITCISQTTRSHRGNLYHILSDVCVFKK